MAKSMELTVKAQDGTRLHFKIRPYIKLRKLLIRYCERKQLEFETVKFLYNGQRVSTRHTAQKLKMKNGDEIYAMLPCMGA
ncbi:hypothetical protein SLA2020_306000 [Shorea laevis]